MQSTRGTRITRGYSAAGGLVCLGTLLAFAVAAEAQEVRGFGPPAGPAATSTSTQPGAGSDAGTGTLNENSKAPEAPVVERAPVERLPLGAPPAATKTNAANSETARGASRETISSELGLGRTMTALVGVVVLALMAAAGVKAAARRRGGVALALGPAGKAPSGVVQVLARYPLQRGQLLVLLKVGPRVLLTCQSKTGRLTAPAMTTLAEFNDPDEVADLVRMTSDASPQTATARFNSVLEQVGMAPASDAPARRRNFFLSSRAALPAAEPSEPQSPISRRVVTSQEGDRAEFSSAAETLAPRAVARPATPSVRPPVNPAASHTAEPRQRAGGPPLNLDGAEQLRRRLARLRSGGPGEIS